MTLLLAAFLTFLAPSLATVTIQPAGSARCHTGWIDAHFADDMGCLSFNTTKSYSWIDANNFCNSLNASLVEIKTEEQHEFLIMKLEVFADNGHSHRWWTSATDVGITGRWFWPQSLTLVEEWVWGGSEPNTLKYNCMVLHSNYNFMGYDYHCANDAQYPICQAK